MNELQELLDAVADFVLEREWEQYHTPSNLAKAISIEAAELLEHFQWTDEEMTTRAWLEAADVLIYLLCLFNSKGMDARRIRNLVLGKIEMNAEKYPVGTQNS